MINGKLATYVSTCDDIDHALANGVEHLILEDAKVSLRSYHPDDYTIPHFEKLKTLVSHAKTISDTVTFSFNMDIMAHERHFGIITDCINTLKNLPIEELRIQDPGLLYLAKSHTNIPVHLALETGNQNTKSFHHFSTQFSSQLLSNELPYQEIKNIQKTLPKEYPLDIQVFGPILIQYSNRRYISGLKSDTPDKDSTTQFIYNAQDKEYPSRFYPFYDNPHGHLMYLYFDRCLIKYLPRLMSLNLRYWILDGRGESRAYLSEGLRLFRHTKQEILDKGDSWAFDPTILDPLTKTSLRPFRPGFFHANNTDQERNIVEETQKAHEIGDHIATVIDYQKGALVTLESKVHLEENMPIAIITSEGKKRHIHLKNITPISSPNDRPPYLVTVTWQKGFQPHSKLFYPSAH